MKKLTGWITQHPVAAFFSLTYATSWGLWMPWMLSRIELLELFGFVGLFGPALACIVIARVVEPSTTEDHRRARRIVFLAAWILATAVFTLNTRSSSGIQSPVSVVVFAMVGLLPAFVIASGFSANSGVRARLASLVRPRGHPAWVWFFWILWHMPLHFAGLWNPDTDSLVRALAGTFFARFIFTWLYNRSEGGIWTAILLHASANVAFEFLPVTRVQFVLEAAIAIAVVLGDRMWKKLPADHPAVWGQRSGATDWPRLA